MEIRHLLTFIHVAELNSFSKAAQSLGYSQSTVSFQIKQLEDELNCLLFERINHTISLTKKGQELLAYAHTITNLTEEFKKNLSQDQTISGHIRIVTPDSICENIILNHYPAFYNAYPKISLKFSTGDTSDMFTSLNRNEADIIFTLDTHVYDQDYVIVKEEKVRVSFVVNPNHPLTQKKAITLADLIAYPFILTEKNMGYRRVLDNYLAQNSYEVQPILEISRTDLITETLKQHPLAISFLPDFVFAKDDLVSIEVKDFDADIWKQLIYHKNKWMSSHLDAFIQYFVKNEFR